LEMLWAGVYRPVPLITTLCTVVPLVKGHRQTAQAGKRATSWHLGANFQARAAPSFAAQGRSYNIGARL
jgi:hypothetical protein